jgi:hypothetical protein
LRENLSMSEIFLSYARVDDEIPPAAGDCVGWVKYFYQNLWCELRQRVSGDLQFWRDVNDIEPDGDFAREIEKALQQAVVMVAVLSPNYVKRPWCLRELGDFAKASPSADAAPRSEQIFKILKNHISEDDLPVALRNRGRGYSFFEVDPEKNIVESYFVAGKLRDRYEQAYLAKINELAERIRGRLPKLLAVPPVAGTPPPSRFVFVAPPPSSSTVMEIYRVLTKQLETEGFGVLPPPGDHFPDTLVDAKTLVAEALVGAELAIHLIGESGGKTCDGAIEPMVPMQLRLSHAAVTERPELGRLIWFTDKPAANSSVHAELLRALADCDATRAPLLPGRDEIVSGTYDSFFGLVQRTLQRAVPAPPQGAIQTGKTLYIVAADEDVDFARVDLRAALRGLGIEAEVPLPRNRPKDVRDKHETMRLQAADAVLVLWGAKGVDWVEDQLFRFRKQWQSLGRSRPFDDLALGVVDPNSEEKDKEKPAAAGDTINLRGGVDATRLQALARRLGIGA